MRKRIEGILMLVVGLGVGGFSLSANYGLLMHPKFRGLSLIGAVLVVAMGLAAVKAPRHGRLSGTGAFLLLLAIALLGRPFTRTGASTGLLPPPVPEHLAIDEARFPLRDLRDLVNDAREGQSLEGLAFSALGTLQRVTLPEGRSQPALMRSYMACCVADALGLGFRLADDLGTAFQPGDWVVLSGTLTRLNPPLALPGFRMGTATFATVQDRYVIEPSLIADYRITLPTLSEQLASASTAQFVQALQTTDLWEQLLGQGLFTVFAPMNEAMPETPPTPAWLARHIVVGRFTYRDLFDRESLETVAGHRLAVRLENGRLTVGEARLVFKNKLARNGVVHIIYPCISEAGGQ